MPVLELLNIVHVDRARAWPMSSRGRFLGMTAWAEQRFHKPAADITITDVDAVLPQRNDLQELPFEARIGGRVRFRLRAWPTDDEADTLRSRARHFTEETHRLP